MSIAVIGWLWMLCAAVAQERLKAGTGERAHALGKLCAAQYWIQTELPRVHTLCVLCENNEDSYARMEPDWF
jgi:butyryl-CoA dehydrogenase